MPDVRGILDQNPTRENPVIVSYGALYLIVYGNLPHSATSAVAFNCSNCQKETIPPTRSSLKQHDLKAFKRDHVDLWEKWERFLSELLD